MLGEFRAEDKLLIVTQSGKAKAVKPNLAMHFENDLIVLEKWKANKPISVIYFDGEKERYYVKRFVIEVPEKEEIFISEHPKSQLEIVATDYRPLAEVFYSKRSLANEKVDFEKFISVKGIKAQGNQLTTEKIKQVNLLEPFPFEEIAETSLEAVPVIYEEVVEENRSVSISKSDTDAAILEAPSAEDKATIALERAIAKKKAEEKRRDDESQTKLF